VSASWHHAPAWTAVAAAGTAFIASLASWSRGGTAIDIPWAPTLGLRLSFTLDGLGALYCLLASGIGVVVFGYGACYLPLHLEHERESPGAQWRFWPWMALFMAAMMGLALAQDLVLLFVLFDVTAICSYFLIGFDRDRPEARVAALMALVVTGVTAVAVLIAAVLLYTSELKEVQLACDRAIVIFGGQVVAEIDAAIGEWTRTRSVEQVLQVLDTAGVPASLA